MTGNILHFCALPLTVWINRISARVGSNRRAAIPLVHMRACFLILCSYIPGSLLCALGRKVLMIPLSRYVDDFYSADRADCAKSAMDCFVRYALRDLCVHMLVL